MRPSSLIRSLPRFSGDRLRRHSDDRLTVGDMLMASDNGVGPDDRVIAHRHGCDQDGAGADALRAPICVWLFWTPSKLAVTTVAPMLAASPTSESPR